MYGLQFLFSLLHLSFYSPRIVALLCLQLLSLADINSKLGKWMRHILFQAKFRFQMVPMMLQREREGQHVCDCWNRRTAITRSSAKHFRFMSLWGLLSGEIVVFNHLGCFYRLFNELNLRKILIVDGILLVRLNEQVKMHSFVYLRVFWSFYGVI